MNVRAKKIFRDLTVNKARSLLIIFAVAIGVAAFGLMLTGRIVLEENLRDVYAATNPAQTILTLSAFDDELLKDIRKLEYVDESFAFRLDSARLQSSDDIWLSLEIYSLPEFDSIPLNRLTSANELTSPPLNSIYLERSLNNVMQFGDSITVELLNGD